MKIDKILKENNIKPYGKKWQELDVDFREKYAEYVELENEMPDGDFSDIDNELIELFFDLHEFPEDELIEEPNEAEKQTQAPAEEKKNIRQELLDMKVCTPKSLLEYGIIKSKDEIPTKFQWKDLIFENKSPKFKSLFGIITFKKGEHLKLEWHVKEA